MLLDPMKADQTPQKKLFLLSHDVRMFIVAGTAAVEVVGRINRKDNLC